MAQQTINVGTAPNDGTGTPLRTAFQYTNSNFSELYTAVGPSGNNIVCPGTVTVSAGTLALPSLTTAGDTNTGIYFPAADTIGFAEGGVEAMRINSAGNLVVNNAATISGDLTVRTNKLAVTSAGVGFGTTTPAYPAHFRTTSPVIAIQDDTSAATGVGGTMNFLGFTSGTSGANIFAQIKGVKTAGSAGGEYQVFTSDSAGNSVQRYLIDSTGVSTWSVAGSTAMTLNSTGLGVGVASPTSKLTIGTGSYSAAASGTTGMYTTASGLEILSDSYFFGSRTGGVLMTLTAAGNLGIGVTPAGTGGCLQLKSGITFPATQVASSDANTLDDYEEGTFTPTIVGTTGAGTGTYTTQLGRYTKVGRIVTCDISLVWTAHDGTGNIDVGGLPFSVLNTTGYAASAVIGYIDNIALTAGNIPIAVLWWFNTTKIRLNQTPTGGGAAAGVPMDSAGQINLSITYIVA